MIAVAARGASSGDVATFTRRYFGSAPVNVYRDTTGAMATVFGAPSHPTYRFVTGGGRLTRTPPGGFPVS